VVGRKKTPEEIEKIRQARLGVKLSEEHRKRISESNKGKRHGKESKRKISIKNSGCGNGMYGKPENPDARYMKGRKISQTKKSRKTTKRMVSGRTKVALSEVAKRRFSETISDEVKDEIVSLYKTGKFIKRDLSEKFGVPLGSIKQILRYWESVKERNLTRTTPSQREGIILSYENGDSYVKISESFEVPVNKVKNVCKGYRRKLRRGLVARQ
jgi:hypothetical protein